MFEILKIVSATGILLLLSFHYLYFINYNFKKSLLIFSNFLVLWIYTFFLIVFALEKRNVPLLTTPTDIILILSWVLLLIFVLIDTLFEKKSIGIVTFPFIVFLSILGMLSIDLDYVSFYPQRKTLHKQIIVFLNLFSYVIYFYVLILAIVYRRIFVELKYNRQLFFSKRLPGINTLEKYINIFLFLGNLILTISIIYRFTQDLKIKNYLVEFVFFKWNTLLDFIIWSIFCFIFAIKTISGLSSKKTLIISTIGFSVILINLFFQY